ncbi:hypothetical protein OG21DRAFT_1487325 [Imleria badia]|nr:hypothetical protein OG21DRAFT_1487325 [Imleria badia]
MTSKTHFDGNNVLSKFDGPAIHWAYPHPGKSSLPRQLVLSLLTLPPLFLATYILAGFPPHQHDKWKKFGLALHTGVEPFSGRILWMKVWHGNQNPQLILSYYLESVQTLGYVPMVTQSDPGTENMGVANTQTMLRQMHDAALQGFEALLNQGVIAGCYDSYNTLQKMLFRWVFIPWLQRELDNYKDRVNHSRKRRDRNKVLPQGVPELIHESPEEFGVLDFKVAVDLEAIDHVRQIYIDPHHVVFDLVPSALGVFFEDCYNSLGCPPVTRSSVWAVYNMLLHTLRQHDERALHNVLLTIDADRPTADAGGWQLPPGLNELPDNEDGYMGGVANGTGLQTEHHVALDSLEADDHGPVPNGVDNIGGDDALNYPVDTFYDDEISDDDLGWDD